MIDWDNRGGKYLEMINRIFRLFMFSTCRLVLSTDIINKSDIIGVALMSSST